MSGTLDVLVPDVPATAGEFATLTPDVTPAARPTPTPAAPAAAAVTPRRASWGAGAGLVTVATVVLSLGNYSYSFLVVHLMGAREFSRFSAAQGLMLVLGSGCMAAIPWAMARFIAERDSQRARQEAMHFGLIASSLQGVVFAVVAGTILWLEAGAAVGIMVAISAFLGSLMAVPIGFLQGVDRIRAIVLVRVLEFVVRFGSGILIVVVVSRSAAAALVGYPIGAAVLLAAGLSLCRSGLPAFAGEQSTIRALARQSVNLGAIQVFLSMLGALDTVAALAARLGTNATASYQSAALLGRIPIFLSASIGLAAYVHVVQARNDSEVRDKLGQAIRLYGLVVIPLVIACLTVPDSIVHLLIPQRYGDATALLRFTVVSGAAVGWIDVVSTAHQARSRFRPATRILGAAAVAQPILLICTGRLAGMWVFASVLVAVSVTAALWLSFDARAWLPRRVPPRTALASAGALVLAILLHGVTPAWMVLILVIGLVAVRALAAELAPTASAADSGAGSAPSASAAEPAVASLGEGAPEDAWELGPPGPAPIDPKVLIVGDSWINGLGARGQSFAKMAAVDLAAPAVLDISAVSKTVAEALEDGEAIRAFGPDLAILLVGGTESLVHPGPIFQRAIQRFGPDSWKGLTGLEPRAVYSRDPRKRRRQRISAIAKHVVKRGLIRLTGGGRRTPLSELQTSLDALIGVLDGVGCAMVFVSMLGADERLFPGTPAAMHDTQQLLEATLRARPGVVLLDACPALDYYGDFLVDNLHLSVDGHRRVADVVVPACRALLESVPPQEGCMPPNPVQSAAMAASTSSVRLTSGWVRHQRTAAISASRCIAHTARAATDPGSKPARRASAASRSAITRLYRALARRYSSAASASSGGRLG